MVKELKSDLFCLLSLLAISLIWWELKGPYSSFYPTTDSFYCSLHADALINEKSLTLSESVYKQFKSANVTYRTDSNQYVTKTGPYCGIVYVVFWPLAELLTNNQASLEQVGKAAASIMVLIVSIMLFVLARAIGLRRAYALFVSIFYLFCFNTLSITSQASWIHAAVAFVQVCILLFASKARSQQSKFYVLSALFALSFLFAMRAHAALLILPVVCILLLKQINLFSFVALLVSLLLFFSLNNLYMLGSHYGGEIGLSLYGFTVPSIITMLSDVVFSPNQGFLWYLPLFIMLLLISVHKKNSKEIPPYFVLSAKLSIVGGLVLTAVWWAGSASLNPSRLISDCSVVRALLAGYLLQCATNIQRAILLIAAVMEFFINLLFIEANSNTQAAPIRANLAFQSDEKASYRNYISKIYGRRHENNWDYPYTLDFLIGKKSDN